MSGDGAALFKTLMSGKAKKQVVYGEVLQKKWKNFLIALEAQLADNQTKFLAGDQVTIADFCGFSICHNIMNNERMAGQPAYGEAFNKYANLVAYAQTIEQEF